MAFYGRITNESQTSMAFDRVYPNRLTMDAMAAFGDGVFASRFVLVEYDENKPTEKQQVKDYLDEKFGENAAEKIEEYVNLCAEAAAVAEGDEALIYNINYRIDKLLYPKLGRGYDSVVFRKVIEQDGTGYYAMMAELNSVVPSFDIVAEAPSEPKELIKPHFDEDSSNVYYRLHMGTPWQFKAGTIAYNKNGFNKGVSKHDTTSNYIKLNNVKSNNLYYDHTTKQNATKEDTKELVINLPAIGNMVADGYDRIYGVKEGSNNARDTEIKWVKASDAAYEQTNRHRLVQTTFKDDGIYYPKLEEDPEKMGNIASATRSAFDLMGMIIEPVDTGETALTDTEFQELAGAAKSNYIYYRKNEGEFYYRGYEYTYSTDNVDPTTAKKFIEVPHNKIHEYSADTVYNRVGNKSYELAKDETATSNTMYYSLDLADFTTPLNTDQMEIEFTRLRDLEQIYELSQDASNNWVLTKPTVFDETKLYCYVPNKTSLGERSYYPSGQSTLENIFLTSLNARVTVNTGTNQFNFPTGSEAGVIYDRIREETSYQTDEYGNPDPSKPIITIELQPAAISEQLRAEADDNSQTWQNKPATVQALKNTVLYIWPKNNTNLFVINNGEIEIANTANTDAAQSEYVWLETEDGFILQSSRPHISATYTSATNFINTEKLETWQLSGLKLVTSFYKPNDKYWGGIKSGNKFDKVYLKTSEVNDNNPTYDIGLDDNNEPKDIELTGYRGVNPGDDDVSADVYFVPGVLYTLDQSNNYIVADEFSADDGKHYYKGFETYIAGFGSITSTNNGTVSGTVETEIDPLGEFNAGERWNINLDLTAVNSLRDDHEKVILGRKTSRPKFILLKEYARTNNTINGWILELNRYIGNTEDPHTRDLDTLQGVLNTIKDTFSKIENLEPDSTLGTDVNGHIITYPGSITSLGSDISDHIQNQLTVSNSGNVISNMSATNGRITATKANVGTLAITGFTVNNNATGDLATTDTINAALNKLQAKIKALTTTVGNNNTADKVQDFETSGTGDYVASMSLSDKKLTASLGNLSTAVNGAILSAYTTSNISGSVVNTDTVVNAIAKLQVQINAISNGAAGTTWSAAAPAGTIQSVTAASVADGDTVANAVNKLQAQINNVSNTTYTATEIENNYAKIFRQSNAPTGNNLKSGWIWIDTDNGYVYFRTGNGASGTWELLNSWQ